VEIYWPFHVSEKDVELDVQFTQMPPDIPVVLDGWIVGEIERIDIANKQLFLRARWKDFVFLSIG